MHVVARLINLAPALTLHPSVLNPPFRSAPQASKIPYCSKQTRHVQYRKWLATNTAAFLL